MAYYYGEFRSIDTSTDPLGQLYKVEICTDVKTKGQYQWKTIERVIGSPVAIPDNGTKITMAATPFTVSYENDNKNVYKPYKCSTATVGMMLNNYISDFTSVGKNNIYVQILKYDNDVYKDGSVYKRHSTGETVTRKTRVIGPDGTGSTEVYYNDFSPSDLAKCYTIEWCGYATPNTYNQDYASYRDVFELECQDILSTFQYYEFKTSTNRGASQTIGLLDFIQDMKNDMAVWPLKNVYVTNSIHIGNATSTRSIIEDILTISGNWINEDGDGNNYLEIVELICMAAGLTIIQWKNNLYLINPDAISGHRNTYLYGSGNSIDMYDVKDIGTDCNSASANTNINTTSTYKKIELTTDEYLIDDLYYDIDDEDYYETFIDWDLVTTYTKVDGTTRHLLDNDNPITYDYADQGKAVYSGSLVRARTDVSLGDNTSSITCYHYPIDTYDSDSEYLIWNGTIYNRIIGSVTTYRQIRQYSGCTMAEYMAEEVSSDSPNQTYMKSYSGKRCFMFHTPYTYIPSHGGCVPPNVDETNFTSSDQDKNLMLNIKTKRFYVDGTQALLMNGDITFYAGLIPIPNVGWSNDKLYAFRQYMYIWMKIAVKNTSGVALKYLTYNEHLSKYEWSDTECWCKVWYDSNYGLNNDYQRTRNFGNTVATAFENTFQFTKNTRGQEGTCVKYPSDLHDYCYLDISFAKPFGCATERRYAEVDLKFYQPLYTILEDFEVNCISADALDYRYTESTYNGNNKWSLKIAGDNAIDDYSNILLKLSSNQAKSSNNSIILTSDLVKVERFYNSNTGKNWPPEANCINMIAGTYKKSNMVVNTDIHNDISPISCLTWESLFPNKVFIVDNIEIDYAKEIKSLSLFEKQYDSSTLESPYVITNVTRNFRRNGDNLTSELPQLNKRDIEEPEECEEARAIAQFYTMDNGDSIYYNAYDDGVALIKDIMLECCLYDGNANIYMPDYLESEIEIVINNNEITINY